MTRRWLLALTAVCLSGCADDGATQQGPDAQPLPMVEVAATDGTLALPYWVAITGTGQSRVGNIAITSATGSVTIRGESYAAVVYEMQPWPEFGYTLFQTLAVSADNWYVLWFYCEQGELTGIYSEAVSGGALSYEPSTGTCAFTSTASQAQVQLPAVSMHYPNLNVGFDFNGPELSLTSGATGSAQLGGEALLILPFEKVDCTTSCGGSGWWELHAILYDPADRRACFGIFYMFDDRPGEVDLTYSLTLPDLIDLANHTTFTATWSAP